VQRTRGRTVGALFVLGAAAFAGCAELRTVPVGAEGEPDAAAEEGGRRRQVGAPLDGDGDGDADEELDAEVGDGEVDAGPTGPAAIDLVFGGGCQPAFVEAMVVTNSPTYDTLAVSNSISPGAGNITVRLQSGKKSLVLSTAARVEDGDLLNIMAGGVVYTNVCNGGVANGCTYDPDSGTYADDPVKGTIHVAAYRPEDGVMDLELTNVALQATSTAALCRVSGRLRTFRLGK